MCGIAGIFSFQRDHIYHASIQEQVAQMLLTMQHRGPDQWDLMHWSYFSFGMTRLRINNHADDRIPYSNENGSLFLVCNGEIYNHQELRGTLRSYHHLRTTTDSETLVHLFEERGIQMLTDLNGMFGFALYDAGSCELFLCRDRAGEKNIYYYHDEHFLAFASEIKALLCCVEPQINDDCESYHIFEACVGCETLFKNIFSLLPGYYLHISAQGVTQHQYWSLLDQRMEVPDDERRIIDDLTQIIEDAVKLRTGNRYRPLAAMVSGGIDSALVASIARPDLLFTCSYRGYGPAYDEFEYAQAVAEHVRGQLVVVEPTREMFEGYRDTIAYHLDLPCTWSSFNIYVLSREIAQHTNVCLSGEGMDELFGGYIRYLLLKHELALYDVEQLKLYDPLINRYLGRLEERYFRLINRSSSDFTASRVYQFVARVFQQFDPIHAMGIIDFYTTMQIMLHMNDRMGMAHGLEIRSAFLDHRLVTYAFCMPSRYKINGYVPKYIIRQVARNLIPRKVYERIDKRGFITPFNLWFGGNEGNEFDRSRYRQWVFEDWLHAFFGSVPSTSKSEG